MRPFDVFISYNKTQVKWVRQLVTRLKEVGIRPFFDEETGLAGTALAKEIAHSILISRSCIIILTPESVESKWVGFEVQQALHYDPDTIKKFLIPLLLKDCEIPDELKHIAFIDCRHGLHQRQFDDLIKAISQRGEAKFDNNRGPIKKWWWCNSPSFNNFSDIEFINQNEGFIVGDKGIILKTINKGRTWQKIDSLTKESLYSIKFHQDGINGIIVGAQSTILETKDSGDHWMKSPCDIIDDLMSIASCNSRKSFYIVSSSGIILHKEFGMRKWQKVKIKINDPLWSITFSRSGKLGCCVGANGSILVSKNYGKDWTKKDVSSRSPFYTSIILSDDQTIWIVGDQGQILVSKDSGNKWSNKNPYLSIWEGWLNSIAFSPNGNEGWIVGTNGLILSTRNKGKNWEKFYLEDNPELVSVMCQDDGTSWIVGQEGVILSTYRI